MAGEPELTLLLIILFILISLLVISLLAGRDVRG